MSRKPKRNRQAFGSSFDAALQKAADEHNKLVSDMADLVIGMARSVLEMQRRIEKLESQGTKPE